jgi:hypothetical protein
LGGNSWNIVVAFRWEKSLIFGAKRKNVMKVKWLDKQWMWETIGSSDKFLGFQGQKQVTLLEKDFVWRKRSLNCCALKRF